MADNLDAALTGQGFEAAVATRVTEKPDEIVQLVGRQCESGDLLVDRLPLPAPRVGDLIAMPVTGAYTISVTPFGNATEYEPWSKLQSFGAPPWKKSPKKQSPGAFPLIFSGVDQVRPPSVDIEPKIGDSQKFSSPVGGAPQVGLNLNTVHVT